MPKIRNMEDMEALSDNEFSALMPDEYLDNPELYLQRYGEREYLRIGDIISCRTSCLIRLTDGSRLEYYDRVVSYQPELSRLN